MKNHFLLGVLLLIGAAGQARGQEVRELTVAEAVRIGLQQNARVAAARAQVTAAGAQLRRWRANRLPTLRASADYTRLSSNIPNVEYTLPGSDTPLTLQPIQRDRYTSQLSLEHNLFSAGRSNREVAAAEHTARAAQLYAQQEDCDVAFGIRRAYWELHRALAVRASLTDAMKRVETHLQVVQARVREGAALRRDLLAAQTRVSEVRLDMADADKAVDVARLELNYLTGLSLDTQLQPAATAAVDSPAAAAAVTAVTVPRLDALRAEISAQQARLAATESARWPQLDVIGRYLYAQPNPYFFAEQDRFRHSWELGFATRWNVWDGGRRSAESGELRAQLTAAEARLADAGAEAEVLLRTRQLEVTRAWQAIGLAAQHVREAEETYRVIEAQFREGAALAADVLDAEEAFRRAHARQSAARADYETAQAAVLQAHGVVWP